MGAIHAPPNEVTRYIRHHTGLRETRTTAAHALSRPVHVMKWLTIAVFTSLVDQILDFSADNGMINVPLEEQSSQNACMNPDKLEFNLFPSCISIAQIKK